jgi:hypothetical protein
MTANADWDAAWDELWDELAPPPVPAAAPPPRRPRGRVARLLAGLLAILILVAGLYAGHAWIATTALLQAIDRQDAHYLAAHADWRVLQAHLQQDLLGLLRPRKPVPGGLSPGGPSPGSWAVPPSPAADQFLLDLAQIVVTGWGQPATVARLVNARVTDPGTLRAYGPTSLAARVLKLVPEGLTEFRLDLQSDRGDVMAGVSLCLETPGLLLEDWRLAALVWPELGGNCQRTSR